MRFGGTYPQEERLRRLLRGIGIIKSLQIKHEYLTPSQERKIELFEDQKTGEIATTAGSLSNEELAAKNLVDHINNCLRNVGRTLTRGAIDQLSTYAGEVMDNATEHSGGYWFIKGYYDHHEKPHYCEIAIFNFGKTIAQTFMEIGEDSYAYRTIIPCLQRHDRKNYFSTHWRKEDLITLMALQGDVSSKNESEDDTRGMGTVEMIEFFDQLARECLPEHTPEMAIMSGSTHIRFDGTHRLTQDDDRRRVIAFNTTNDLGSPPDSRYVSNIEPLCFPGTVISVRFELSNNQLTNL